MSHRQWFSQPVSVRQISHNAQECHTKHIWRTGGFFKETTLIPFCKESVLTNCISYLHWKVNLGHNCTICNLSNWRISPKGRGNHLHLDLSPKAIQSNVALENWPGQNHCSQIYVECPPHWPLHISRLTASCCPSLSNQCLSKS